MNSSTFRLFIIFLIILLSYSAHLFASNNNDKKDSKVNYDIKYSLFNINNISTYIYNNGEADLSKRGDSGFEFPKGSNKALVYSSGFVFGGKVNGEIRVGGSTYNTGLTPGKIKEDGTPENPNNDNVRVFRVRPDYKNADFTTEGIKTGISKEEILTKYENDWYEWPAKDGAPFEDKNENGIYEPEIDTPGIIGASQTLWFVTNDLDSNQTKSLYGSLPLGIELQVTIWGYSNISPEENMLFKKYTLINKSENNIDSMFVSMWADPDVGGAGDDYIGCDSLLNLGFAYNADNDDTQYQYNIPAVGFSILQGPLVDAEAGDFGLKNGEKIFGKKNLEMTSAITFLKGSETFSDPSLGDYIDGTLPYWNYANGKSFLGDAIINLVTEHETKFMYTGDPVMGEGWLDGTLWGPGDRRMMIAASPFTLAEGETQEVIFAEIAAGGQENVDRFDAIQLLKYYTQTAHNNITNYFEPKDEIISPEVEICELDQEIILSWYNDPNLKENEQIENFQGYTVYQFPNNKFQQDEAKEIFTFDIIDGITKITTPNFEDPNEKILFEVAKNGTDSGIKRHISIKKDIFHSSLIVNGKKYYFRIGAYSVSGKEIGYPRIYESISENIVAIPQSAKPGNKYYGRYGSSLELFHTSGNGNAQINVKIVNPKKITGLEYKLNFYKNNPNDEWDKLLWQLIDENNNTLLQDMSLHLPNYLGITDPIIIDGFQIEPFIIDTLEQNLFTENDQYSFTTPQTITEDKSLAKKEVQNINVFPNPYYGKQRVEFNQHNKYVTINHLPEKAIIRIYNLAGHLVKKITKNDNSQFIYWNLLNDNNFYVASGLYIIYIEMPELNEQKILKLAVITENVIQN